MRPIVYTAHARERMERREIAAAWVERVLGAPVEAMPDPDPARPGVWRAYGPVPEHDGRMLRVVYVPEPDHDRVITVFLDRGRPR